MYDDQVVIITDTWNHRILEWHMASQTGQILAGGKGPGNRLDQLHTPTDALYDPHTNSVIVCDSWSRRVIRWNRDRNTREGEVLIENIRCWGLAIDDEGSLYISDIEKHEVRRYRMGDRNGTLVAGGHGQGSRRDQLNWPTFLFVDRNKSLYISDHGNQRVVRWDQGAKEGVIVIARPSQFNFLAEISAPQGIFVDALGTIYVSDSNNHRVMRWLAGERQGTVIAGGHGRGNGSNQLNFPTGLCFDPYGNLYVVDCHNHRVQSFTMN